MQKEINKITLIFKAALRRFAHEFKTKFAAFRIFFAAGFADKNPNNDVNLTFCRAKRKFDPPPRISRQILSNGKFGI